MSRPTQVSISRSALQHNLQRTREIAPNSKVMVPVKCDAYGHGIKKVVSALSNADGFAVACLDEALVTRGFTDKPIIILEGLYQSNELSQAYEANCEVVVHCLDQLEMLEQHNGPEQFNTWLKINTGMCRLGINPRDFEEYWQRLHDCACVNKPVKLMTHFANADDPNNPMTSQQIQCFFDTIKDTQTICSLANSGATLAWPDAHADWIRPGIMIYGASPFRNQTGPEHGLKPAMTLSSSLISIHHAKAGDRVGYCSQYECPEDMAIGVIAIGYGDGYPHSLPSGTPVLLNGHAAPLIGNVSMDMSAVDLRQHPEAKIGDTAIIWGEGLPVEKIARLANTIPYELFCNIHKRVIRE